MAEHSEDFQLDPDCWRHQVEVDLNSFPMETPSPSPPKPELPGIELHREFIRSLRQRRRELGLSQDDVNHAMGMADCYVGKMESFARRPTWETLSLWMETLGLVTSIGTSPHVENHCCGLSSESEIASDD